MGGGVENIIPQASRDWQRHKKSYELETNIL